jgi:hypothetical protein
VGNDDFIAKLELAGNIAYEPRNCTMQSILSGFDWTSTNPHCCPSIPCGYISGRWQWQLEIDRRKSLDDIRPDEQHTGNNLLETSFQSPMAKTIRQNTKPIAFGIMVSQSTQDFFIKRAH